MQQKKIDLLHVQAENKSLLKHFTVKKVFHSCLCPQGLLAFTWRDEDIWVGDPQRYIIEAEG